MKRLIALLLCIGMIFTILTGCSGNKAPAQANATTAAATAAAPAQSAQTKAAEPAKAESSPDLGGLTLPLSKDPVKLTVWTELSTRAAASIKSYSEMPVMEELKKRTNIEFQFIHPPVGQEKEQFNLMLASNQLPDIIYTFWQTYYIGGPEKAISDGVVVELSDLIKKYCPNFSKILKEHPDVAKDSVTDNGHFVKFPLIKMSLSDRVSGGVQIRQDWLDKLGLKMPTNMDEMYNVLTAFKTRDPNGNGKADEIPFISTKISNIDGVQRFTQAWGMDYGYYVVDGKVKFAPVEPDYKQFLTTMRKWYKEGLIDPDFLTTDRKTHDAKVTSNIAGSYYGLLNSFMGTYTGVMKEKDPSFKIVCTPVPIAPDGKQYGFLGGAVASEGMAISSQSKHKEIAAKFCDYLYSDQGRLLWNLGIEGLTYKMENGFPKYTELITKNPDKLPLDQAVAHFMPVGTSFRLYQDPRYWQQMMAYDNQVQGMEILAKANFDRTLPPISPSPEESSTLASIQNEINTYVSEMYAKFIMGQADIDSNYDNFVKTIKSMKLDDAIGIQQKALDRYNNRGK